MTYNVVEKNSTKRCNEDLLNIFIYSYGETVRKTRFGSVWQEHVVMWDVCLERSFSDYLCPVSFCVFGLLCSVVLGGSHTLPF